VTRPDAHESPATARLDSLLLLFAESDYVLGEKKSMDTARVELCKRDGSLLNDIATRKRTTLFWIEVGSTDRRDTRPFYYEWAPGGFVNYNEDNPCEIATICSKFYGRITRSPMNSWLEKSATVVDKILLILEG
jgi:hypothetical protein